MYLYQTYPHLEALLNNWHDAGFGYLVFSPRNEGAEEFVFGPEFN